MSHKAIESVAIKPHNIEAARVDTLMPEQLRGNASSFLDLLTEYYNYMNIDGVVNGLNIIVGGSLSGEELQYDDLNSSDTRVGINVTGFVPSTYNQTYVRLTDNEILAGGYPASQVYQGLTNNSHVIMKVDTKNSRELFRDTWVMATVIDTVITVDFYDRDWKNRGGNAGDGSRSDNLEILTFREHLNQAETGGGTLFYSDPSKTSAAFTEGIINHIAMTDGDIPVETSLVNFTNIPTRGGHGQDLTVDIVVDEGQVVSIVQNKPGFGYRMDDSIILDDRILEGTIYSIAEVIASPSNVVRRILDEHDIDKTTEDYLSRIAKEIAASVPEAANLDRNYLYKKIVEYYSTRGSQDSIQSFFKIFFDVPASVSYPKDVLFKPSDGEYRGSSAVSESLEKYFYKKGYANARRIHFFKKPQYDDVNKGTYFIDFEFGKGFKRNATAPLSITQTQQQDAYKETPLFSGQHLEGSELNYSNIYNVGVVLRIDSNGNLVIKGRFGTSLNNFEVTYSTYVLGTNELPFSDPVNDGKRRVRLAISVDKSDSSGLLNNSVRISMTNSGETDNDPIDGTAGNMTIAGSGAANDRFTLYPGAIGQTAFVIGTGAQAFIPDNQNPDGEYYVTSFIFIDRLATNTELKDFVNNQRPPSTNKIVDIDLDNNGSVNFTNKNSQSIIAKQIEGVISNGTGEENTRGAPLTETNYGLSSTGSEYPRRVSWKGVKGFLSNEIKLHDSDYYQEFSYVIRTSLSTDRWQTEYQKLIHPAGLKFFTALYLELASRRFDQPSPPNIDLSQGIQQWLPAIQETVDVGSHSPKWQPGWLEYLFTVLIEIIVYEQYSYRALLQQPGFNQLEDTFYDHDNKLRIKQFKPGSESSTTDTTDGSSGFTLSGNTKNAIINNVNESPLTNTGNILQVDDKYITLDGNGTGIKTEGKIDKSSTLELTFKLLESGDTANGKYVAGCKYRGQDGHDRELSIKQITDNGSKKRVEVLVTDNAAQATDAQKDSLTSFRVISTQNDVPTQEHGVFFSDSSVTQSSAAGQTGSTGNTGGTYNHSGTGHHLIIFDPSAKTYEAYRFNTQAVATSNETDLVSKITHSANDSSKILILYTSTSSSCRGNTGALRNYIASNYLATSDGTSDTTSTWNRRRVAQVLVIRRGVLAGGKDLIYEKLEDKDLTSVTNESSTNKSQVPLELSFQYDSSANLIRGPHIGIRKNSIAQPVISGKPLTIECNEETNTNQSGYTKLIIGANGQIEQYNYDTRNYEIKRSELEASDPKYLSQLNLSGYDWEYLTEGIENNQFINGVGGSNGHYYDEEDGGIVTTGGPRWIRIKNSTLIDESASYSVSVTVKNVSDRSIRFDLGHIGLDSPNGNIVSTDSFNTNLRNLILEDQLIRSKEVVTLSKIFGGYNPPNTAFDSQAGLQSHKFDPKARAFDLFFISNYVGNISTYSSIAPNRKALVIKSITLTKLSGNGLVENNNITKVDPNFGFKKIATSSLPIVPKRFSVAATNLTFPNTLAIGTLNEWTGGSSNPKLAGVHEIDRSSDLAADLLKTQGLLPLRAGKFSNFIPTTSIQAWQNIQLEQSLIQTGEVQRIYSDGPFGNREVVFAANPDNNVSGKGEIGFNSGTVSFDRSKDYRISCFFKLTGAIPTRVIRTGRASATTIEGTKFKFGFSSVNNSRLRLSSLQKKRAQTSIAPTSESSTPFFMDSAPIGSIQNDRWYYIQGYVTGIPDNSNGNPNNHSMARYLDAGIYDVKTGNKQNISLNEFCFNSSSATRLELSVRIDSNNDNFINQGFEVTRTRIDEVGSAGYPSVSDLLQVNERSRFNSNLQVSEIFLDGEKENSIKHLITETDQVGITFDRITADSPNHNPIPATETATAYTPISYSAAKEESVTLKDIMSGGGGDAKLLSVTGIKTLGNSDSSHKQTNAMRSLFDSGERFSLMSNDLDANLTSSTRDFTIANNAGVDKTSEVSGVELEAFYGAVAQVRFARFRIIKQGIGLDEFDVITIPKAKLGLDTTANDVKLKVRDVGKGTFTLEQNSLSNANDNKMYLTRASTDDSSTLGINGGFTTDKFEWEKDKAYEITFNATKIFDRNTPANLYIGANKIGYFSNLLSVAGGSVANATGNPNAFLTGRSGSQDGDGPHEFIFDSSIEGRCRIFLFISDAESSFRLAHNGHQLRVDNTNSDLIARTRIPDDYWNRGTTKLAKVAEDNEANINADVVRSDSAGIFVFESEFLSIGENVIQLYCLQGDGIDAVGYIYVQPADNGLITEGANTHKIYIPNTGNSRIVIDHKIDRDVSRTFHPGANTSMVNKAKEDEKLYEYNWKLENIKVREKRKRVYNGNFRCIVADPASGVTTVGDNTDPLFGTPSYRPVDVSTPSATDGAIGSGGELIVPALVNRTLDADADVGQEHTTGTINGVAQSSLPMLGVPKGKYGVLRLEASNVSPHYISIGDNYPGSPFKANGLFTIGETYEISGYVYIPSTNSKIQEVYVMAGINSRATNEFGGFEVDAAGNSVFVNPVGENQILTGELAGYDSYSTTETTISTKGSWQYFKHKFVGPSSLEDEFPLIRFVGTLKGEGVRANDSGGYTGDASGEFFYIKNIVIKEGFDSDMVKGKDSFDSSSKGFANTKDNVEYDLVLNPPATNREACVAIDLKHPADSNFYRIRKDKYQSNLILRNDLEFIPLRDSNLLSSYLPFTTINTATNTPVDGQPIGYYNGEFQPLGNPTSGGASTFQSTLENEIIVGESPFGGSERIWRAKNKDGAWAQISTIDITGSGNSGGSGYQVTYTNVDNTMYSQPSVTYTGVTSSANVGSGATFNVTKSITGYTATLAGGGNNYQGPIQYNNPTYTGNFADTDNADLAEFNVRRVGALYEVDISVAGEFYTVGDAIFIAGDQLGGAAITNDLTIDIIEVDSGGAITKITHRGNGVFNGNQGDIVTISGSNLGGEDSANNLFAKITAVNANASDAIISFTVSGTPAMVNDKFQVIRKGSTYAVTQSTIGTGYTLVGGDVSLPHSLIVTGDKLGGASTTNDLTINITGIDGDGIVDTITSSGTADAVYDDVPIEDTQSENAGVGAKASLTIDNSGVVTNVSVTNGGLAYGRSSASGTYITTNIPVAISSGYFSAGSGFVGEADLHADSSGNVLTIGSDNKPISLPDGGFRTPFVNVDVTRTYRCSVWIRQSDVRYGDGIVPFELTDGGHKRFRWTGHNANGDILASVNITGQGESTEPSFIEDFDVGQTSTTSSSIEGNKSNENKWFLLVGHIRPFDHTGTTDHEDSGIYLPTKDGQKTKVLTNDSPDGNKLGDWKFTPAMKKIKVTAIQIANPLGEEHPVDFYAPRIDELNGLEPSIAELTSGDVKYKLRDEDIEKKLQLINWNTPINDVTEPLGDYNHAIEGDDFNISIDEVVNNIEYADAINSTFDLTTAPKSTLIEIEIPASGGTNTGDIMLPFQKINDLNPATHNISIDWGDNTSDFVNGTRDVGLYHQYTLKSSAERYIIKVQGTFNRFNVDGINSSGPNSTTNGITPTTFNKGRNNFKSYVRKVYLGSSPISQPSSGQGFNLQNCTGLTHFISVKGITNTSALTKFERTFKGCSNLKHIDVRGIDTSNATSLNRMFMLGKEVTAKVNMAGHLQPGATSVSADTFSGGTGSDLEVGMRMYSKTSVTDIIGIIDSIQSQSTTNVTFTLTNQYQAGTQHNDNAGLRFVEPVTGVKMIGLHTFDISSLATGTGTGMNHMLTGVTINSDEVSRCIVAWANDTYGTSPSASTSDPISAKLRFDFGNSKFFKGNQFDDINDTIATEVVTAALSTLTGTKAWLPSFNTGDVKVTAETGTFDF